MSDVELRLSGFIFLVLFARRIPRDAHGKEMFPNRAKVNLQGWDGSHAELPQLQGRKPPLISGERLDRRFDAITLAIDTTAPWQLTIVKYRNDGSGWLISFPTRTLRNS